MWAVMAFLSFLTFVIQSNDCFLLSIPVFVQSQIYASSLVMFLASSLRSAYFQSVLSVSNSPKLLSSTYARCFSQIISMRVFLVSIFLKTFSLLIILKSMIFSISFPRTILHLPRVSSLPMRELSSTHCHIGELILCFK